MALHLLLLIGLASAADVPIYKPYLDMVYAKSDDGDGKLDLAEFTDFLVKADLVETYTAVKPIATWHSEIDTNGDGIIEDEFTAWIKTLRNGDNKAEQKVAEATVTALVGVSTDVAAVTEGIGEENKKVTQAAAFVALKFTLQAAADELFPGERKDLKQRLATLLSVALDEIFLTITSGSANVEAKAFYKSTADADTAEAAATSSLGSPALASSYLGTTVTDSPTVEKGAVIPTFTLDPSLPGGIGGVAFLLAMLTIGCAKFQAAKKRKAVGAPYKGPCSTGCCSAYSLRGWSVGVLTVVVFNLVAALLLFVAMDKTTQALKCIVSNIIELSNLEGDAATAIASLESVVSILKTIKPYIDLLNVAVIVPAVLVSLTLLVTSACEARKTKNNSKCCMKTFALVSMLLMVVCLVFYCIFAALAIAINEEFVQDQLKVVTSLCETTMPVMKQTLSDAKTAVTRAKAVPGVDTTELSDLEDVLAQAKPAAELFDKTCDCITDLFFSFEGLFVPGLCCVVAAAYGLFIVNSLCVAAKCCCKPTIKGGADEADAGISKSVQEV